MARPGGGLAGSGGHLGDALHRHAGIHHSRPADPLQRSAHDRVDAGRDRRGGSRPGHCQLRPRRPVAAARRWCHRRNRGRQHALHGHGGDEHARQRALQGVAVPRVDRDRHRGRHRGAVGRHPGTRDNRDDRGLADHGCRGERHALHRYGRHVPACRSDIEHGEHVRQHGFQLHRAAAVRHQPADLRADPGYLAVANRGRDRRGRAAGAPDADRVGRRAPQQHAVEQCVQRSGPEASGGQRVWRRWFRLAAAVAFQVRP
jgi:hypothetical protein